MKRAVYHSAVWLVVPLWVLLVGTILARFIILVHANDYFAAHARHIQGVVLKKFQLRIDHFTSEEVYGMLYSYRAENVEGRDLTQVEPSTYHSVHVGGPLPIAYLPGDPKWHRIDLPAEIAEEDWVPFDDLVIATAIFVPGVLLIGYFGRRNRIHAQLLASGAHAWGEVTELNKTHTRHGSHSYLIFHFTTPGGRDIQGRTQALPEEEHSHWNVGDPIQVRFDPNKPDRFAVDLRHPLDGALVEEPAPLTHETIWA